MSGLEGKMIAVMSFAFFQSDLTVNNPPETHNTVFIFYFVHIS